MNKLIYIAGLLLFTLSVNAHQPTISTTMLVENENKTWALQISASLTAFQQEVRLHFSEAPYETPEEFQKMVIEHVKNNLEVIFNDAQGVTFSEGVVRLGHETKVVFEIFGVPENINSVLVKNETFKDIHNNKSALVILKEGFNREEFVLNKNNNHMLKLEADENRFQLKKESLSESSLNVILILIVLITVGFLIHSLYEGKVLRKSTKVSTK